jgi:hypothetical protein
MWENKEREGGKREGRNKEINELIRNNINEKGRKKNKCANEKMWRKKNKQDIKHMN